MASLPVPGGTQQQPPAPQQQQPAPGLLPPGVTHTKYLQSISRVIDDFVPRKNWTADDLKECDEFKNGCKIQVVVLNSDLRDQAGRPAWDKGHPAGSFRPFPDSAVTKCKDGFYCPDNTTQPLPCPAGYACKTPSEIKLCSRGTFCPMGSPREFGCGLIIGKSMCPPGTEQPLRYASFSGVIVVCLAFAYAFYLLGKREFAVKVEQLRQAKIKEAQNAYRSAGRQAADDADKDDAATINEDDDGVGQVAAGGKLGTASAPRATPRLDIAFDKIGIVLPDGRQVLKDVTGKLYAGRLTAVMGPSGAGKSTFFTRLMGKVDSSWQRGTVTISNKPVQLHQIASYVGFVPQEDVMIRTLTVDQILSTSARLRLPAGTTPQEVNEKKDQVLDVLGLVHVKDQIIGDEANRGISGGQRKRVNIGIELVAEPRVLFLDEPTSGLDSSSAYGLCNNLRGLARSHNMVIAAVIHSPSPLAFAEFDDVYLLGVGGVLVYAGPVKLLPEYLAEIGHPVPRGIPIADHAMDVLQGKTRSTFDPFYDKADLPHMWESRDKWRANPRVMGELLEPIRAKRAGAGGSTNKPSGDGGFLRKLGQRLLSIVKLPLTIATLLWEMVKLASFCLPCAGGTQDGPAREVGLAPRAPVGFFTSFIAFGRRAFLQAFPSVKTFIGEILMHVVTGTIVSFAIVDTAIPAIQHNEICEVTPFPQNLVGCRYVISALRQAGAFLSVGVLFAGISVGSQTFGKEIVPFWREQAAGLNPIPYFLAKVIVDLGRILAASIVFTVALSFAWPYRASLVGLFLVVLFLYFVAFAIGYFLSAVIPRERIGLVTTGVTLLFGLILSGALPGLETINGNDPRTEGYKNEFLYRLPWIISAPRYVTESIYIREAEEYAWMELKDQPFLPGTAYYKDNYRLNFVILVAIGLAWQVLAFLALKLTNRAKQR